MSAKPVRNGIFISYSHKDKKWLERLRVHLKPLEREHNVTVWDDTKLRSGEEWRMGISEAIGSTKAAILLVSADFLASDFINNYELPPLLSAASEEGLIILPIIVDYFGSPLNRLSQYQTVNEPTRPLNTLPEGQAEEVFSKLVQRVHEIFVTPTFQDTQDKTITYEAPKATKSVAGVASNEPVPEEAETPSLIVAEGTNLVSVGAPMIALDGPHAGHNHSALLVKSNGDWAILRVSRQSETRRVLSLTFQSPTPAQRAFLISLRQYDNLASIAYSKQTYPCKLKLLRSETEGIRETWYLDAIVGEINLRPEVAFNRVAPSMQAQIRARVLLLDEASPGSGPVFMGMGSYLEIRESPFPSLYRLLGKQANVFNEAAKLIATWYLQIGCIVEHILELELSLKDQVMIVNFKGKRRAEHQKPPAIIRVEGTCDLSRPVATRTLRLGPLNRY